MGTAFDHWQTTGTHPASDPQVRLQLARAFAPVTFYRTMASLNDGEIVSPTTGYPVLKDVSYMTKVLYRLGINSTELDRAYYVSNELYSNREKKRATVAKLGEAFASAQTRGDNQEMALVLRQAMVWGVDASSVLRSAMARLSKQQEDMIDRAYRPGDIQPWTNVRGR